MNVYQDIRISFSDEQYNAMANLACPDHDMRIVKEFFFTSVWIPNHKMPWSLKRKKNYKNALNINSGEASGIDISNLYSEKEFQIHISKYIKCYLIAFYHFSFFLVTGTHCKIKS